MAKTLQERTAVNLREAEVHAHWHRTLDDPLNAPEGPIRDHVLQVLAKAWDEGADTTTWHAGEDNPYRVTE